MLSLLVYFKIIDFVWLFVELKFVMLFGFFRGDCVGVGCLGICVIGEYGFGFLVLFLCMYMIGFGEILLRFGLRILS